MEFEEQEEEIGELPENYNSTGGKSGTGRKPAGKYRECLKNHAVSLGGHAVDGCGEFMPAGEDGTLDALKCAACNCHRNFHRKETDGNGGPTPFQAQLSPYYRMPPAGYLQVGPQPQRGPPTLALPYGVAQSREDLEDVSNPSSGGGGGGEGSKKRFRTKFTSEQKEKMLGFAERVGWRIQKQDEEAVNEFCTETHVKRHVLKVWMHNNKHTLGKKP
ncbi:zinc-finger homeodomain protein 2-like [Tasmannia lanceolata]|uniref:zinc-finger homeodomain protein 2-like n=1 Tax=Tasmannia lanceolata TaxID=3420 RepID=UPI004063095E